MSEHNAIVQHISKEMAALDRLLTIARSDTGQSARVANFLLAWWNADRDGGFNLADLWMLDHSIIDDMQIIFGMIGRIHSYPDSLGLSEEFHALVTRWRQPARKRRKAGASC